MSVTPKVIRFLLPVLVVLLSGMGACAMYDVTAFEPEGWEEEEQKNPSTPETRRRAARR